MDSGDPRLKPAEHGLNPGFIVDGRYQLISRLGAGGMSVVYRARQLDLERVVALKMLHSALVDANSLMRLQREAVAITSPDHPSIVKVFNFGFLDQTAPYLAMEYVEGTSPSALLKERGKLTRAETMAIITPILDALEQAHSKGIIHRDVKPSNVLLAGSEHTPKLLDFGIAKLLPESGKEGQVLTRTEGVLGTLLYMSPEQCLGAPVDARSDLYSVGCLMFEMLTGSPPFTAESPFALLHKQAYETAPVPDDLNDDFGAVIIHCLKKEPGRSTANRSPTIAGASQPATGFTAKAQATSEKEFAQNQFTGVSSGGSRGWSYIRRHKVSAGTQSRPNSSAGFQPRSAV